MSLVDRLMLSCKQKKAMEELRMRMKGSLLPSMIDDEKSAILDNEELMYYRFLKARDFDVDKAEKMMRKCITWRKANQVETIREDFTASEVFMKYLTPTVLGLDKEGDFVMYESCGILDPEEAMNCFTMNNLRKHWIWFAEKILIQLGEEYIETGKKGYQGVLILDIDQVPFSSVRSPIVIDVFIQFVTYYQDNYPERMKICFVINAPSYIWVSYSLVRRFISSNTLRKIHIFGNTGWKEKLLEVVDADVLPAFLGGTRTDPDGNPRCETFINHAGRIPQCYALTEKERYFTDISQVKKLIIPPDGKEEIHVEIEDLGTLLHWEFLIKGKDIGFGIFLETSEYKKIELIPIQKCTTADGAEKDSLKCRSTGTYIIVFNNADSWFNSKEVQYCIRVVKPTM